LPELEVVDAEGGGTTVDVVDDWIEVGGTEVVGIAMEDIEADDVEELTAEEVACELEAVELTVVDAAYSTTLLSELSLTHTFPAESTATPLGAAMSVAVAFVTPLEGEVTKSGCPKTRLAFSYVVKGVLNLRALANDPSATHNEPDLSKLKAVGLKQVAVGKTQLTRDPPL
jgi:hypothetical protein